MCQVIFKATGITSAMVPPESAHKISNLLITTAENGVSTHQTFLAAVHEFNEYLEQKGVQRPVVLLSDGHSSRLNHDVLSFLLSNQIQLFVTPPDTTGVTQLLDQLNKNIHQEYEKEKAAMFTNFNTLNREAFMLILANIWNKWVSKEIVINAARKVGITASRLSVELMQQDKFARAAACIENKEKSCSTTSLPSTLASSIVSPNKRRGSARYWEEKFNQAIDIINDLQEKSIELQEIPGLMSIQRVKPKLSKKNTRVTQVHGSMKANRILDLVKGIEDKKQEQAKTKEELAKKKDDARQTFLRCNAECVCQQAKCMAIGLKQCPVCKDILKSNCSKGRCQVDGKRPIMIIPAAATATASSSKSKAKKLDNEECSLNI